MREQMFELIRRQRSCVLATTLDKRPHCSLMGYLADPEAGRIHLVTLPGTRKYRNIQANPHCSLLIDDRGGADRGRTRALTGEGRCTTVSDGERAAILARRLEAAHPHLAGLLHHPDRVILEVAVRRLILLDGPEDAYVETFS